mgnify:CR=1 FL=1
MLLLRHSSIKKKRTTNYNFSTWDRRQIQREERKRIKQIEKELKEKKENEKAERKRRREENEQRRIENERKSEKVQKVMFFFTLEDYDDLIDDENDKLLVDSKN